MSDFNHDWLDKPYNELTDAQLKAIADFYQDWRDLPSHRACVYMLALRAELTALRANSEIGQMVRRKFVSVNGIPVERCHVTAKEVAAIDAAREGWIKSCA